MVALPSATAPLPDRLIPAEFSVHSGTTAGRGHELPHAKRRTRAPSDLPRTTLMRPTRKQLAQLALATCALPRPPLTPSRA
jgi:hypothetical protein